MKHYIQNPACDGLSLNLSEQAQDQAEAIHRRSNLRPSPEGTQVRKYLNHTRVEASVHFPDEWAHGCISGGRHLIRNDIKGSKNPPGST